MTGSSRTADIEKILVLGAHGPRRLVVLLSEQSE
ncbi:MAG: LUD domain-containing protein [Candidatus Acidiferrales bacterium]